VYLTDFVEIEGKFAGNRAVEPSLEESGPVLRQDIFAAVVFFADACDARVHVLAAVDVLDGRFTEKEIDVVADVVRSDEIGFCESTKQK